MSKIVHVDVMRALHRIGTDYNADADAKVKALAHLAHLMDRHGPIPEEPKVEPKPEPSAGFFRFVGPGATPGTYVVERMVHKECSFEFRPAREDEAEAVPEGTLINAKIY